ncbi:LacI family DNA-binding transcriptional regulator [Hirschia litorea]|uniref:LacI family DNA-binding transcriptional regulator n=1 Tax=Hirschia litorea TaxID=1199156 RepID=A0ABW2IIL7_9PROT
MSKKNETNKASVTLIDVAKHAGVSPMTVSRVLNNLSIVKSATREKVLSSVERLNYSPNQAARSLAGGRSTRICLLYGNPSSAYLGELLMGALEAVSTYGYQLVVNRVPEDISPESLRKDLHRTWDGLIISPPMGDVKGIRRLLNEEGFPTVYLGCFSENKSACEMGIDDYQASIDVIDFLVGLGHSRIGFIQGHPSHRSSAQRLAGVEEGLRRAGLPAGGDLVVPGFFTYRSGMEAGLQLLKARNPPTAIFAANDDMAAGVLAAASEMGLKVPRDVSVVGFDDSPIATTVWPNLTTIRQPLSELAGRAVKTLGDMIGEGKRQADTSESKTYLEYSLIKRESAAAPKAD